MDLSTTQILWVWLGCTIANLSIFAGWVLSRPRDSVAQWVFLLVVIFGIPSAPLVTIISLIVIAFLKVRTACKSVGYDAGCM